MSGNFLPFAISSSPWQLPLPGDSSPLSGYGVGYIPQSMPTWSPNAYNLSFDRLTTLDASVAASLNVEGYFSGSISAGAQFFMLENVFYQSFPLPAAQNTWDPNIAVLNLYAGFGYRIFLAAANLATSDTMSLGKLAANVTLNGSALTASVFTLGISQSSPLYSKIGAVEQTLLAPGGFTVDQYALYSAAVEKVAAEFQAIKAPDVIPAWVGVDLNQADGLFGFDYPGSVCFALNQIALGASAQGAAGAISGCTPPTTSPQITISTTVIDAVYSQVLQTTDQSMTPNGDQQQLASTLLGLN